MGITKRVKRSKGKKKVRYQAAVWVRGKRIATKSFDTKSAAHTWHEALKREYEDPYFRKNPYEDMTLKEVFQKYKEIRVPQLREYTQQTQAIRHKYLIESPIFELKMSQIDARAIDRWFEWLRRHPTAISGRRKNFRQEFILLRAILNWYRNYLNEKFVVPIVKRHSEAVNFKQVPARRPDYYMRIDQIQDWISWLRENKSNPLYYRLATFMVLTGCRIGETCGLFWDAVDLRNGMLTIIRTAWWEHRSKNPQIQDYAKTSGSIRIIRLSNTLDEIFQEMKQETKGIGPVFCINPGEILRYNTVQNAFNEAFKALDLPWRSTHICRHSFATLALQASRDINAVQAALGHDDIQQTQHYAKKVAMMDGVVNQQLADLIDIKKAIRR